MSSAKTGAGCFVLIVFSALVSAFFCLHALRFIPTSLTGIDPHVPPVVQPEPPPDPDKYKSQAGSLREFARSETADAYTLRYGFIDHHGKDHRITCQISKQDHQRESEAFGYVRDQIQSRMNASLLIYLKRELEKRNLALYFRFKMQGFGGYHWTYHLPADRSAEEDRRLQVAIADFKRFLDQEFVVKRDQVEAELYRERGFVIRKNLIVIDHGGIVLRNQQPLIRCYEALKVSGAGYNERQYIGLYLAFFQEIRYELPPDLQNGKKTQGLYVPTEVLVNGHGDCDSKTLAFCAMMRAFGVPLLVVDLPHHVLAAVETRPGPGQAFVRLGNRYFVLCEVAGPAKLYPGVEGNTRVSGNFEYTLIEPR